MPVPVVLDPVVDSSGPVVDGADSDVGSVELPVVVTPPVVPLVGPVVEGFSVVVLSPLGVVVADEVVGGVDSEGLVVVD